jgi:hypothetical protein
LEETGTMWRERIFFFFKLSFLGMRSSPRLESSYRLAGAKKRKWQTEWKTQKKQV